LLVCKRLIPLVSSLGWGKPTTWRRGTGRRHGKGGRVRDAHEPEPQYMSSTGELIDIERVTISSEGGRWKSTHRGNSLAAYPTSRTGLTGGMGRRTVRHRALCLPSGNATTPKPGTMLPYHTHVRGALS